MVIDILIENIFLQNTQRIPNRSEQYSAQFVTRHKCFWKWVLGGTFLYLTGRISNGQRWGVQWRRGPRRRQVFGWDFWWWQHPFKGDFNVTWEGWRWYWAEWDQGSLPRAGQPLLPLWTCVRCTGTWCTRPRPRFARRIPSSQVAKSWRGHVLSVPGCNLIMGPHWGKWQIVKSRGCLLHSYCHKIIWSTNSKTEVGNPIQPNLPKVGNPSWTYQHHEEHVGQWFVEAPFELWFDQEGGYQKT